MRRGIAVVKGNHEALLDEPEVYNLPQNPQRPSNNVAPASFWTIVAAMVLGLLGILFFKE